MKSLIACLPLCLLVQGCVGAALNKAHTYTFPKPIPSKYGHFFVGSNTQEVVDKYHLPEAYGATDSVAYTSEWFESRWGKPASIARSSASDHDEIWTYKGDRFWKGLELYAVIPIPLKLPVGRSTVELLLRDKQLIKAVTVEPDKVGWFYGLIIGPDQLHWGACSY